MNRKRAYKIPGNDQSLMSLEHALHVVAWEELRKVRMGHIMQDPVGHSKKSEFCRREMWSN